MEVGAWAFEKHELIRRYVNASEKPDESGASVY